MHFAKHFIVAIIAVMMMASICDAQVKKGVKEEPLKVGDKISKFKLNGQNGSWVESEKQFGENGRPAILLFSRANW